MRNKFELDRKVQELNHKLIDLELLGCARTQIQEREMAELKGAYNALLFALGVSEKCRVIR